MCLAVPGRVESVYEDEVRGTRMGRVNFGGVVKEVCLAYLPDLQVGDYTIVHVGFAISKVDEATAVKRWRRLRSSVCSKRSSMNCGNRDVATVLWNLVSLVHRLRSFLKRRERRGAENTQSRNR